MKTFHWLKRFGDVYVPTEFRNIVTNDAPMRIFEPDELNQLNRIFDYIRRGGVALLSGRWDRISELIDYAERKKGELVEIHRGKRQRKDWKQNLRGKRRAVHKVTAERSEQNKQNQGLSRLMVIAEENRLPDIEPSFQIPYLLELIGDTVGANEGFPFLVSVMIIREIQEALMYPHFVSTLNGSIVAHKNVLLPRCQESLELIQGGLQNIAEQLPLKLDVLDMGCGSGCLALLAARVFEERNIKIIATDHLPEALAITKINVQRFIAEKKISPNIIEVTKGGDLFEPISEGHFDLILFNAPWVVSPARTRAETAIHDEKQDTVRRFLSQASNHLKDAGHILLEYSDNSGAKAIENLEEMIRKSGFRIANILKDRIQTRRAKRKWEAIFLYDLM